MKNKSKIKEFVPIHLIMSRSNMHTTSSKTTPPFLRVHPPTFDPPPYLKRKILPIPLLIFFLLDNLNPSPILERGECTALLFSPEN